jgi:hypothetical protein
MTVDAWELDLNCVQLKNEKGMMVVENDSGKTWYCEKSELG